MLLWGWPPILVVTFTAASQVAPVVNAGDSRDVGSVPGSEDRLEEGMANPLQYSCLENPMDRGAWRAIVRGVAKSQTPLKLTLICLYLRREGRGNEQAQLWATAPYPPQPVSVGKHVTWTFTRGTLSPECLSTPWSPPHRSRTVLPCDHDSGGS